MELFGGCGNRPMFLHNCQRPQLTDGQFPQKTARHETILIRNFFVLPKDIKILLI
jgi:hypothetical protein